MKARLAEVFAKAPQVFYSQTDPWYGERDQAFARAKIEPGWYLVRKDEVPSSTSQRWEAQKATVEPPDFVPDANLAVYAYSLHYLATGERLFSRVWVRTNSVTADGSRVSLSASSGGLGVDYWRGSASGDVGVAAARKSN